jgi:hypothetical protein
MSTGSVRGFERHRYDRVVFNEKGDPVPDHSPIRENRRSKVDARNKKARKEAQTAFYTVKAVLDKAGLTDGPRALTVKNFKDYLYALKLAAKNGFTPFGQPTYWHLHPTKGYRKAPI